MSPTAPGVVFRVPGAFSDAVDSDVLSGALTDLAVAQVETTVGSATESDIELAELVNRMASRLVQSTAGATRARHRLLVIRPGTGNTSPLDAALRTFSGTAGIVHAAVLLLVADGADVPDYADGWPQPLPVRDELRDACYEAVTGETWSSR